uniref:Uncharacterized protein n=2 Tax=viral metagenome TaxID=1070528 RepID=A0A6H1ZNV9_9ZZZZ
MSDWLKWECAFKDGTTINQFDETGFETTFKKVQENIDKVSVFKLVGDGNSYSVSLSKGSISINNTIINFFEDYEDKIFRLIFFKRRLTALYTTSIETDYFLGFQSTVDGKNFKNILRITKEKNYLLSGDCD